MFTSVPVEYRTLFLGDLSIHCTEQHVQQLFEGFGMIEQVRLKHASMSQSLSYAFITFVFRGDAEKALNQLNGSMLLGRKIRMNWATPKNSNKNNKDRVKENPDNLTTAQIHFSFIAKNVRRIHCVMISLILIVCIFSGARSRDRRDDSRSFQWIRSSDRCSNEEM